MVFVYGTLKRGQGNHHFMERARFVGESVTEFAFTLVDCGGLPMVRHGATSPIKGEVYRVDKDLLQRLDMLEGHPRWYRRRKISAWVDGKKLLCWLYFNDAAKGSIVSSGDWRPERAR